MEFMSRWFVGSSRRIMSGLESRSLLSATLVFWPPDSVLTLREKSFSPKPSPFSTPVTSLLYAYPPARSKSCVRRVYCSIRVSSSFPDRLFISSSMRLIEASMDKISCLVDNTSSYMLLSDERF